MITDWQKDFIRLLQETIDEGCPPDKALKYWGYALGSYMKKEERESRAQGAAQGELEAGA